MEKKDNSKDFLSIVFKSFLIGILAAIAMPLIAIFITKSLGYNFENTGTFGDAIGGSMSPIIGIVAAGLTFLAFWVQYDANQQQRKDIKLERFESRFYEMLHLHKENVNEIKKLGKNNLIIEGRSVFPSVYKEFVVCFKICSLLAERHFIDKKIRQYDAEELIKLAYAHLYTGIGETGIIVCDEIVGNTYEKVLIDDVRKYLNEIKRSFKTTDIAQTNVLGTQLTLDISFTPYRGYISRISHYYRHLYQTVKFVDEQDFLKDNEKYNNIKILRAQLSDHEQVMLYYNVVSKFGRKWIEFSDEKDLSILIKYKMIHNVIPKLVELGISPYEHNEIGSQIKLWHSNNPQKEFFEWYE